MLVYIVTGVTIGLFFITLSGEERRRFKQNDKLSSEDLDN